VEFIVAIISVANAYVIISLESNESAAKSKSSLVILDE
jgi:hypothetical protein